MTRKMASAARGRTSSQRKREMKVGVSKVLRIDGARGTGYGKQRSAIRKAKAGRARAGHICRMRAVVGIGPQATGHGKQRSAISDQRSERQRLGALALGTSAECGQL